MRLDRAIDDIFKQVDIVVDLEGHDGYEFTGKERKDVSALRVNEQSDKGPTLKKHKKLVLSSALPERRHA